MRIVWTEPALRDLAALRTISRSTNLPLKLVATTPADQAFRPLSEGGCPLVHA